MKKLFLLILLTISFTVSAEEMIPLSKYTNENPKFKEDLPSAAYFTSRCSAVMSKAANRLKQDNRGGKYQDMAKLYEMMVTIYDGVGLIIIGQIGMSQENFFARYKTHLDAYEKQTMDNWKLNGDMFTGWVGDDLNICKSNYKYFENFVSKNIDKLPN